ncbi:hypothetical protein BCR43DRAFT_486803 [Syncephalastrum racemosum]|uniref:Uncharacterized protein n=1 Tax=Syncephalastrum racemosum TaxID=13706 RepID=A0A1X2HPP3_SYNRA|nr:hypothetical protein BCR43DRAFT_486803 [Syncephalastrum racemosum]
MADLVRCIDKTSAQFVFQIWRDHRCGLSLRGVAYVVVIVDCTMSRFVCYLTALTRVLSY